MSGEHISGKVLQTEIQGEIKLPKNQAMKFGRQDYELKFGDIGEKGNLVLNAKSGTPMNLALQADAGEDAGDKWQVQVADGGVLSFSNDIATQDTFVPHMTITPHATVASSDVEIKGNLTVVGNLNAITNTTTTTVENFKLEGTNGNLTVDAHSDQANDAILLLAQTAGAGTSKKLVVEDDSLINQDLTTDADVNFASTTLSGDLVVNGGDITSATAGNAANVFATTTGKTTLGGGALDLSATGSATTVKGTLNVDEAVTLDTTLDVTGDTSVSTLDSSGATSLATGGGVVNIASTGAMTTVKGTLNVDEAVTLDTTLDVTGDTSVSTLDSSGATSLATGGGVVNIASTGLMTTVKGTLNVDEAVTLDTTLDVVGTITASTLNADGDTAAGAAAAIGYTAVEGIIITGQGSTNDVTIKNDADADVLTIATGTTNVDVVGSLTSSTLNVDGDTAAGAAAAIGYTAAEGIIITGQGSTNDVTIKNDADADVLTIATGTTNVDVVGSLTASTLNVDGDTAAGATAAIGYAAADGIVITGQGSTNDVTIKNDADQNVLVVPTGTQNVELAADLTVAGTFSPALTSVSGNFSVGDNLTLGSDEAIINLGEHSEVKLIHVADQGVQLDATSNATNGTKEVLEIKHQTSGTPAAGIGSDVIFTVETAANNHEKGMKLSAIAADVSDTAEDFDFVVSLMESGAAAAQRLKVDSAGVLSVGKGGTTAGTIVSNGDNDLVLQTGNSTTGGITITDGADGNIALATNGSGSVVPGSDDGAALGSANLNWSDLFLADAAVINLGDDQDVKLTHVADQGVQLDATSNATNGTKEVLEIKHQTSGTPAAGIGSDVVFTVETANDNHEKGMKLSAIAADVSDTAEDFDFVVSLMESGATAAQRLKVDSAGVLSVGKGGTTAGTIASNGDNDLVLQTGNSTTGSITITDGANGNIALSPNGTGNVTVPELLLNSRVCHKCVQFTDADIAVDGSDPAFTDNDVLIRLGALSVSGLASATHIMVKNVYVHVTGATGETHVGNLQLGTASDDSANAGCTAGIEIMGAGSRTGATDIDLNVTGITGSIGRPSAIAIGNKELYLCTTTAISADRGSSLGVKVIVEYDLIKFA